MLGTPESKRSDDPFSLESEVRSYCRSMTAEFAHAKNAEVWSNNGNRYIDMLAGCGALNYGHNPQRIVEDVVAYIRANGITSSMDLHTTAKRRFLASFRKHILEPRGLDYKIQFCGPTGTNAVEAALKLARQVTRRSLVVAFQNGFHGMTLGALAVTSNRLARESSGVWLPDTIRLTFDDLAGGGTAALKAFEADVASGSQPAPAAFIFETVQGEGGLNCASADWCRALAETARRLGALLIVDDVQCGCGRTGPFFSFEALGFQPDIVCLSKSVGGMGMPMALVLFRPELDVWRPGAHNGTFRGNNLAFVAARAAIEQFWSTDRLEKSISEKAVNVTSRLARICASHPGKVAPKGRGLIQGLHFAGPDDAPRAAQLAIANGLLIEVCGPSDDVLKLLPPLTISMQELDTALDIVERCVARVFDGSSQDCGLAA